MGDDATTTPASHASSGALLGGGRVRAGAVGRLILAMLDRTLRRRHMGQLQLTLPSGATATIGDPSQPVGPEIEVRSWRALWKLARRGSLGFAEAYMDGDLHASDLRGVFEYYLANEVALTGLLPRLVVTHRTDRRFHEQRRNTVTGSRRNIADHYDLGNAFFGLWLDPSMLYSSGIYRSRSDTLEDAQKRKIERIIGALAIGKGDTVLEIGCGWGAFAEAAANAGGMVRAITISEQQFRAARDRMAAAGLCDRVEIYFEDYRTTTGSFDRLVSIEMIEAVGEENWPHFFETIADRLSPGGTAVIQAITIREDAFGKYRENPDFIQSYIFPGGMLPTVGLMRQRAEAANLSFETIERFGASYASTLAEWRRRFLSAWPAIERLGFDGRFKRMWLYYLIYCEIGFERGWIDVGMYRMRKPVSPALRRS